MPPTTVAALCAARGWTAVQFAERSGLDRRRAEAILAGRWTPSPAERERVAAAFGLSRDDIAWGHAATVDPLYGHGPQFGRSP